MHFKTVHHLPVLPFQMAWHQLEISYSLTVLLLKQLKSLIHLSSSHSGEIYSISIIIPNGVTSIGGLAFKDCSSLSRINISESVTLIGQSAFSGCSELQNLIIPNGIVEIGYEAFKDCTSLTTVEISKNSKLEKIGGSVFYGCFALSNISPIPASVDSCGSLVFSNCFSLDNVYCEAATQPSTWTSNWLGNCPAEVHWGYTGE